MLHVHPRQTFNSLLETSGHCSSRLNPTNQQTLALDSVRGHIMPQPPRSQVGEEKNLAICRVPPSSHFRRASGSASQRWPRSRTQNQVTASPTRQPPFLGMNGGFTRMNTRKSILCFSKNFAASAKSSRVMRLFSRSRISGCTVSSPIATSNLPFSSSRNWRHLLQQAKGGIPQSPVQMRLRVCAIAA